MNRHRALALLLMAFTAGALRADSHPNTARGMVNGTPFQMNGIDNVNLFNGNLTLAVPIGQRYHVNGQLDYGFTLVYNGNIWDTQISGNLTELRPNRRSNAGPGWLLSLGRLFQPTSAGNDSQSWAYESPDGSDHALFKPDSAPCDVSWISSGLKCYSRDGTYLQVGKSGADLLVEFPDGTYQVFREFQPNSPGDAIDWQAVAGTQIWRLAEIHDRFANAVTIAYRTTAANPEKWTISDGTRTHTVSFISATAPYSMKLDSITLATFNGGNSTWQMGYALRYLARPAGDNTLPSGNNPACPGSWGGSHIGPHWLVDLLTTVTLPAVGGVSQSYRILKSDDVTPFYQTAPDQCSTPDRSIVSGHIRGLRVPTRGWIEWDFAPFAYLGATVDPSIQKTNAVSVRRMMDAGGATQATWIYNRQASNLPAPCNLGNGNTTTAPSEQLVVGVTAPEGQTSVHYFTIQPPEPPCTSPHFDSLSYALPLTRGVSKSGRYLSEEIYSSEPSLATSSSNYRVQGSGRVRSVFTDYDFDGEPDKNRRERTRATYFYDDAAACTSGCDYETSNNYGFDDFGHYRQTSTGGNFGSGNFRTTYTAYPTRQLGTGTWVLNTFPERCTADETAERTAAITDCSALSSPKFVTKYCFDGSTGFLSRTRALAGASVSGVDTVAAFTQSAGNLTRADYYGGDGQNLSTADLCTMSLGTAQYAITHTYSNGALETSKYVTPPGTTDLGFKSVDNTIDGNTGLTTSSRDTAGAEATYDYDALGRLKKVTPPGVVPTTFSYTEAAAGTKPSVTATITASSSDILQTISTYDDFGRLVDEQRALPVGTTKRNTVYNGSGWTLKVSEWETTPTHYTVFSNFDALGRALTLTAPDGKQTSVAYKGGSEVSRTVNVGSAISGTNVTESSQTTTETYDRQHRLVTVKEASDDLTNYEYDALNRLTKVTMQRTVPSQGTITQLRLFTYDGRGFLTSEQHPENGSITYQYDARGHLLSRSLSSQTPYDQQYTYDKAERLTLVNSRNPLDLANFRSFKEFTFAGANIPATGTPTQRQLGKLITAVRHNREPVLGDVRVTEGYGYDANGRLTDKTTTITNPQTLGEFKQSYAFNNLGLLDTITYPACLGACGQSTTDSVSMTYQKGMLTNVANYADLTYGANGATATINHTGNVKDTIVAPDEGMPRPKTIKFETYAGCSRPAMTTNPSSAQIASGSSVTLHATVSGTRPLSVRWYSDPNGLPASQSTVTDFATLDYATPALTATTSYFVRVVNSCGRVDSQVATVTVCDPPAVTTQPQSQTVAPNQSFTLNVAASGCQQVTYQWYRGTAPDTTTPVGTGPSFNSSVTSTTNYWARATSSLGATVNTNTATITVAPPPNPPSALVAVKTAATTIRVSWQPSSTSGVHYEVERRSNGSGWGRVGTPASSPYDDTGLALNTTYVYRVRATDATELNPSTYTNSDLSTTMTFTPRTAGVSVIYSSDFDELLAAVNAVRAVSNHGQLLWSDILPTGVLAPAFGRVVRVAHITALRDQMDLALSWAGVTVPAYGEAITTSVVIKLLHVQELRDRSQ
jgi:YD repeat-containing protein